MTVGTVIEKEQQPLHASSSEWEKNHETDLHQREADAMRERVHGGGPVCHYPGGARSQTPEERQAQHRAPAAAECGARAALPGAKGQREFYSDGVQRDADLRGRLSAGGLGAGQAGPAQLDAAGDPGRVQGLWGTESGHPVHGADGLREKGGEVPPPHSGGVRRADHAAERTVPADTGGQVGPAAAGRQL